MTARAELTARVAALRGVVETIVTEADHDDPTVRDVLLDTADYLALAANTLQNLAAPHGEVTERRDVYGRPAAEVT